MWQMVKTFGRVLLKPAAPKQIWKVWFILVVFGGLLISLFSLFYWEFTYVPEVGVTWRPMDDFFTVVGVFPLGLLIGFFLPTGWLMLGGLVLALLFKRYYFLLLSAVGIFGFGIIWPQYVMAIMGI